MASIRKRIYRKKDGKESVYWQVSYYDAQGARHKAQFKKQSQANALKIKVEGELFTGIHIPDANTMTVSSACAMFIQDFENLMKSGRRERSTFKQYRGHIKNHIKNSVIGDILLTQLQAPHCRDFLDKLSSSSVSDTQAGKVMNTLRMIVGFSEERGWIRGNPARAVKVRRETRKTSSIVIPPKEHVRALLQAAEAMGAREHAFVVLGVFCGLRPSELRGLTKEFVKPKYITVEQRADQWGIIGKPKTEKSVRQIDIGAYSAKVVGKWVKLAPHAFLFSTGNGRPENYQNLLSRFWLPLHRAAKLTVMVKEKEAPLYTMHTMRHVAASLWIEEGYNPKKVQEMLGHSTLQMTMDTYGHLWHNPKEGRAIANRAELSILGTKKAVKSPKALKKNKT